MATAPLSMAIQGYAQAALVSFPQDSNWIQPSASDLNNAYWNAVKGQCPKDVQVWPARDAQGILHLYQPQGGYPTVHTQETTGTNGGEATSTFVTQNRLKALEAAQFRQLTLLTSYLMREMKTVMINVHCHQFKRQVVWEGKFRLNPLQVVVSPEAVMQLNILPSVALAERANLLVM